MKTRVVSTIDGGEVKFLEPENDQDRKELEFLELAGACSHNQSFGDWRIAKSDPPKVTLQKSALHKERLVLRDVIDKKGHRVKRWVATGMNKEANQQTRRLQISVEPNIDYSKDTRKLDQISQAELMNQANRKDIYRQMQKNLQGISRKPSTLSELKGKFNTEHVSIIADDMRSELSLYTGWLAGDTADLMHQYVNQLEKVLKVADLSHANASDIQAMGIDSIRKLIYQDVESTRQVYSDHGIRHIVGNILYQNKMIDVLNSQGVTVTPKEKLMGMFVQINHDVGYTVPIVRATGPNSAVASSKHPEFSEKILKEQKSQWNEGKIFSEEEYNRILNITRLHQKTDLSLGDPVLFTTQIADNTSMFSKEKIPPLFQYIDGSTDLLTDMGLAAKQQDMEWFESARKELYKRIDASEYNKNLKRDLKAAVASINQMTPKFTMGILAGELQSVRSSHDAVIEITVKHNEYDTFLSQFLDMGQKKLRSLLSGYGITDYDKNEYTLGEYNNKALVKIRVK